MYYETSYPSLIAGVSQQLPQNRLPGQLNDQVNMVSDLVRGLCRRGGVTFAGRLLDTAIAVPTQYFNTRVGGADMLFAMQTNAPVILRAYNPRTGGSYTINPTAAATTYLNSLPSGVNFLTATVGDSAVLVTTSKSPSTQTIAPAIDSDKAGYFYVASGAYKQDYTISVQDITASTTYTISVQTPDGSLAAHVTDSTPDEIAKDLVTALVAALPGAIYTVSRDGAYVFIKATTSNFSVISDTSAVYLQTSNNGVIRNANTLPARLPVQADGYTIRIGNDVTALHFRYNAANRAWLEDAQPSTRQRILDLGLIATLDSLGVVQLDVLNSKPRAAGDSTSNPLLACATEITGVASFQGRLVLLSDQYVCMSATNDPTVWFRTTVTALLDSDPIEMALTTSYASSYQSGTVFNGNLLLLANSHQAQVPGDIAITPSNASMALVSNYGIRSNFEAVPLGRSLMLPTNTVSGYVGFVEALPPENLEAMLRATAVTSHIPTFARGALSFVSASNTADTVVFGVVTSADKQSTKTIYVHQYLWANGEKVHSSWHRWIFEYPIKIAYILEDTLYIISDMQTYPQLYKLSLARGYQPEHYLDYAHYATASAGGLVLTPTVSGTGYLAPSKFRAFRTTVPNALLGEKPTIVGNNFRVAESESSGTYVIGQPFESRFSPTAPIIRDRSDAFLATEHIPVVRFNMQVVNTGEVKVQVNDRVYDSGIFDAPIVPHSALQELGNTSLALTGTVSIPSRTEARDTNLQLWTSDFYDFNVTSLEYGFKLKLKVRRA